MATCARLDPPCRGAGLRPPGASGFFGPRCGGERAAPDARRLLDVPHEHLDWRSLLSRRQRDADDEGRRVGVGGRDDVRRGPIHPVGRGHGERDGRDPARPGARLRKLGPLGERSPRIRRSQGGLERPRPRGLGNPACGAPAGHLDAYRIREAAPDGTYGLLYYAPATGNDARTEAYNGTAKVATSELTSYRYQALEPARFFGLSGTDWAIAGTAVAAVGGAVAILWLRRRRQSRPPGPEPNQPQT